MTPFEVLYGCRCRTPLNWIEPREKVIFGPDLVDEAEMEVHHIHVSMSSPQIFGIEREKYNYAR
jgi:hypothetical protein